jgi:hypothetical protein
VTCANAGVAISTARAIRIDRSIVESLPFAWQFLALVLKEG